MLSSKAMTASLFKRLNKAAFRQVANRSHHEKHDINNREIVGFGVNPSRSDQTIESFPTNPVGIREVKRNLIYCRYRFPWVTTRSPDVRLYHTNPIAMGKIMNQLIPFQAPHHFIYDEEPEFYKKSLKKGEKGEWKNLSIEERKRLYRNSFCEPFSILEGEKGDWRVAVAATFISLAISFWLMMLFRYYGKGGYNRKRQKSLDDVALNQG